MMIDWLAVRNAITMIEKGEAQKIHLQELSCDTPVVIYKTSNCIRIDIHTKENN